ncbi:hypothetical protein AAC691_16920 [Nguyenibacter vanlangensis]|uniref:Uncharacterized protein n=1 Tax=Nguyenibacter vanlangensis TaxID=1216886 RepID=A0ABZ3D310_9PROT
MARRSVAASRLEDVAIDDGVIRDTAALYGRLAAYGLIAKGLDIRAAFDPTVLGGVL